MPEGMAQEKPLLTISISLAAVIATALTWSFLVRDLELFTSWPALSKNIALGVIIAAISSLYLRYQFQLKLARRHVVVFVSYLIVIALVNWHILKEAITCDELYHAAMSSMAVKTVEKFSMTSGYGAFLGGRPMTESVALLSIAFIMSVLLILKGWLWLRSKITSTRAQSWFRFFSIGLFAVLVGQMCRTLPLRNEIHPPLRLLPLFVAQTFFGYDDFSFRLPGLLVLAFTGAVIAQYVKMRRSSESWIFPWAAGLLVCMIPTVAHTATIVQPSFWCFVTWTGCFFCIDKYLRHQDERFLVAGAVILGVGALMRQNSIVMWPAIGFILLWKRPNIKTWIQTLFPGLFVVPYLMVVMNGHHAASSDAALGNVLRSITSGEALDVILKSTTPPWVLLGVFLLGIVLLKRAWQKVPGVVVIVSLVPAFGLYFSIWDYLWGIGRYQAEYLGAVIAILVTTVAVILGDSAKKQCMVVIAVFVFYSLGVLRTLHYDAYYGEWPRRRITTESLYPYREALGFLHRQTTGGAFVFVGGVPTYGETFFYLRGFSRADIEVYRKIQAEFDQKANTMTQASDLLKFLQAKGVKYVILQWGDRRELQHRAGWHNNVELWLRDLARTPEKGLELEDRFHGDLEGAVDLYKLI